MLQNTGHRTEHGGPVSTQGPAILINHEPLHSFPLTISKYRVFIKKCRYFNLFYIYHIYFSDVDGQKPEEQIINKFKSMGLNTEGLGSLYYVSTPPAHTSLISTTQLPNALNKYLENTAVR